MNSLGAKPLLGQAQKGVPFKNIISPPKIGPTPLGFGRSYLQILRSLICVLLYVFAYFI